MFRAKCEASSSASGEATEGGTSASRIGAMPWTVSRLRHDSCIQPRIEDSTGGFLSCRERCDVPAVRADDLVYVRRRHEGTRTYDSRYKITENKLTNAAGAAIADYTYAEDAAGNITQIDDAVDATYNPTSGMTSSIG
jgi:hypothetical protein